MSPQGAGEATRRSRCEPKRTLRNCLATLTRNDNEIGHPISGNDNRRGSALRRGFFALRDRCDTREHRGGIEVQYLLARFVTYLCLCKRLGGPLAAEVAAVGAAHD